MKQEYKPGDRVIINDEGIETSAIIDFNKSGDFKMEALGKHYYLCRITDNIKQTFFGGAEFMPFAQDAKENSLCKESKFVDEDCISLKESND